MKKFEYNIISFLSCTIWMTLLEITYASNNFTSRNMLLDEEQLMKGRFLGDSKKGKFLSFNTDDDDITVEMQLSVPFLKIPIKKTVDGSTEMMSKLQSVNINMGALGLAGVVVFGSAFLLPAITKLLSIKNVDHGMFGRAMAGDMVDRISRELGARGAPPQVCAGRLVCWLVSRSAEANERGDSDSSDKIVDGLASNEWIQAMLDDTIIQEAIAYGYTRQNCSAIFSECKLNPTALDNFIKTLSWKLFDI